MNPRNLNKNTDPETKAKSIRTKFEKNYDEDILLIIIILRKQHFLNIQNHLIICRKLFLLGSNNIPKSISGLI